MLVRNTNRLGLPMTGTAIISSAPEETPRFASAGCVHPATVGNGIGQYYAPAGALSAPPTNYSPGVWNVSFTMQFWNTAPSVNRANFWTYLDSALTMYASGARLVRASSELGSVTLDNQPAAESVGRTVMGWFGAERGVNQVYSAFAALILEVREETSATSVNRAFAEAFIRATTFSTTQATSPTMSRDPLAFAQQFSTQFGCADQGYAAAEERNVAVAQACVQSERIGEVGSVPPAPNTTRQATATCTTRLSRATFLRATQVFDDTGTAIPAGTEITLVGAYVAQRGTFYLYPAEVGGARGYVALTAAESQPCPRFAPAHPALVAPTDTGIGLGGAVAITSVALALAYAGYRASQSSSRKRSGGREG